MVDDILRQGVQGITDLITVPGLINLDFADVRTIMSDAGSALMGIGVARGDNRAVEAARAAISSPLLEHVARRGDRDPAQRHRRPRSRARRGRRGGRGRHAARPTRTRTSSSAPSIDEAMGDDVRVTAIATGFGGRAEASPRRGAGSAPARRRSGRRSPHRASRDVEIDIPSLPQGGLSCSAGSETPRARSRRLRDDSADARLLGAAARRLHL